MGRLFDRLLYVVGLATLLYVICCVPLGGRTMLARVAAWAHSDDGEAVRHDVVEGVTRTRAHIENELREQARHAQQGQPPQPQAPATEPTPSASNPGNHRR